eukprot:CAMPEP_0117623120 /NCGR_PEP_ID=MMETSP0784-20121206/88487_1 /TAXON_ID=39447 /ORGANISM="" /LENGTH=430 /DNA_ID=CAMNT_0005427069 /DNA_START=1 /DNA_END=1293 /DNA_ORIENTATION=+
MSMAATQGAAPLQPQRNGAAAGVTRMYSTPSMPARVPEQRAPASCMALALTPSAPCGGRPESAPCGRPVTPTGSYQPVVVSSPVVAPPTPGAVPGGSYVAPPAAAGPGACSFVAPAQVPMVHAPPSQPPQKLTEGIPSPSAIEQQRAAYNKSLEEQRNRGEDALKMQQKQQTDFIHQTAEAQKQQLLLQVEQQAKSQELQLSQQYSQQMMQLQQEYQHQKMALEKQANELVMEYQRRKSAEDMMVHQFELQKKAYDDQMKFVQEIQEKHMQYQQQVGAAAPMVPVQGASYMPLPQVQCQQHVGAGVPVPQAQYQIQGASHMPTPQTPPQYQQQVASNAPVQTASYVPPAAPAMDLTATYGVGSVQPGRVMIAPNRVGAPPGTAFPPATGVYGALSLPHDSACASTVTAAGPCGHYPGVAQQACAGYVNYA